MSGRKCVNRPQLESNVYVNPGGVRRAKTDVYIFAIKLLLANFLHRKYGQVFIFIGQAFKSAFIAALEKKSNKTLLGFNEEFVAIHKIYIF